MLKLSPPGWPILLVSMSLAGLAVASLYWRIPFIGNHVAPNRFWALAIAYGALLAGVVSRRL
ncbi:hypothetical protein [Methylocella sp.]|uniref:hypothetical protein n=1 Tax=Methylocella sp. TaxID=1978226 RepID=UPI003784CE12